MQIDNPTVGGEISNLGCPVGSIFPDTEQSQVGELFYILGNPNIPEGLYVYTNRNVWSSLSDGSSSNANIDMWRSCPLPLTNGISAGGGSPKFKELPNSMLRAWQFDKNKDKGLYLSFVTPYDVKLGTPMYVQVIYLGKQNTTGDMVLDLLYNKASADNSPFSADTNIAIVIPISTSNVNNFLFPNPIIQSAEPNTILNIKISRLGSDVLDTYPDKSYILSLNILYVSNSVGNLSQNFPFQ